MADTEGEAPPSRQWWQRVVGLGLVASATGLFLVSSFLPDRPPRLVGGNRPVNSGARDSRDIRAHNSPTLIRNPVDPDVVVVVNRVDTPRFSCALHRSLDGGKSWIDVDIPFPEGEEEPPRCFAPDAGFDPSGRLYVFFMTLGGPGNAPNAGWVTHSADEAKTFSKPRRALGPKAFQVRLLVDPRRPATLYLWWVQVDQLTTLGFAGVGNPILTARSDDGGLTWRRSVVVNRPERTRVLAPSPAIGTTKELYVAYLDLREDALDYHGGHDGNGGEPYPGLWSLVLARSSDAGATWSETVIEERLVASERLVALFPQAPSLAVDSERNRVYAAFHDRGLGDADIRVWTSHDGGSSFRSGVRANDNRPRDGTSQYLPKLDIAPNGRLDILYYDRHADPDNRFNHVSLQSSYDGGRSFGNRVQLSDRAFDSSIGFGSERGLPEIGSRLALSSEDKRTLAVWTDTRAGTEASNKQDLAAAMVEIPQPEAARNVLRYSAAALAAFTLVWATGRQAFRRSSENL